MKRCSSGGMMRSSSPMRSHDGTSFHSGRGPDGSTSASWVAGRCVVASSVTWGAVTSWQNTSWKLSGAMYRSVVPSLRGTGRAVGVRDEHDRPVDRADEVADGGGVGGEAPQRVGRGDDAVALRRHRFDHAVATRRLGERAVDEDDRA
jgi:hypothetical protein